MAWIDPSAAIKGVSLAKSAIDATSPSVLSFVRRSANLILKGRLIVPVLGAGGTGKTTISKLFVPNVKTDIPKPYSESWHVEDVYLKNHIPGRILVAPGQVKRIPRTWSEPIRAVLNGKSPLVINVVANGYHSFDLPSFREHKCFHPGDDPDDFMEKYLRLRLELETRLLKQFLASIRSLCFPIHMITVVNKQDLWWNRGRKVRTEYSEGEYGRLIRRFSRTVGATIFQHDFMPMSSVMSNLQTTTGELLAEMNHGYDYFAHQLHRDVFLSRVQGILEERLK